MAGEKNFIIKNGLTVGSTEVIDSSGIIAGSAVNEAIDDRLNSTLVAGSGISLAYDDSANTLTVTGNVGDITGVNAGAGLTGTVTSGDATLNIGAGTGITVNADTIEIDTNLVATLTGTQGLTNKTITSPVINTGVSGSAILDSDAMTGASATTLSSSESIKAYVDSQVQSKDALSELSGDTDDVSEGTGNLYFTDERVDDRVSSLIVGGTGITSTYDDTAGTLTIDGQVGDITGVTAGTGLSGGGTSGDVTLAVSGLTLAELDGSALIISSESFTDNDTTVMSSAAIQDKIEAYGYSTTVGDITSVVAGSGLSGGGTAGDVTLTLDTGAVFSEAVADTVGAMVGSNTESGITVAYDDADNTLDFTVATLNQDTTGNAATATALETSRTISGTSFDGTSNVTLNTSAITENTNLYYTDERVDDRVSSLIVGGTGITSTYDDTAGTLTLTSEVGDITSVVAGSGLSGGGVTGDVTLTLDTGAVFQEAVADTVGAMVTSNTESGITVAYVDADNTLDFTIGTLNQNTTGNALTATTLATARTLGGVSFDGSASINLPGVNSAGNQSTSGLAGTATALATARTIHGVSFDGTANISLTEEIQDTVGAMFTSNTESGITVAYDDADGTVDFTVGTLNQNTSGNAATVTNGVYTTGNQTIAGVKTFSSAIVSDLTGNVTGNVSGTAGSATGNAGTVTNGVYTTGTQTIGGAKTFSSAIVGDLTGNVTGNTSGSSGSTTGNAATATALATARTIQGVSFDGTAAITTLTAGTGVSVSGTAVSIGQAVGTSSNVTFGDLTLSGDLTVNGTTTSVASTNTTMTDGLIELANGTTGTPANDTGIVIERGTAANAFMGWDESADKFTMGTGTFTGASTGSLSITTGTLVANVEGNLTGNVTGNVSGSAGSATGNAGSATVLQTARTIGGTSFNGSANIAVALSATATKLATARTISLGGDLSGSASFDGTSNISITAVVADDSHNHTIANVDGLQTSLDTKYASGSNIVAGTLTTSNASNAGGYVRNMYQSTSAPVAGDGAVGDMWVLYS